MGTLNVYTGTDGNYQNNANWTRGAKPVVNDEVVFPSSATGTDVAGYDASANDLDSFTVEEGCGLAFGTMDTKLQVDPGIFNFAGTKKSFFDLGSNAQTVNVFNSATASGDESGLYIIAAHASNVMNLYKGQVAVEVYPGDVGQFATINVGYISSKTGDAYLVTGDGLTLATLNMTGGNVSYNTAITTTTVTMSAGNFYTKGSGAITTLNVKGGRAYLDSVGLITNLNMFAGTTDFTRTNGARAVTNINAYHGSTLLYDKDFVSLVNNLINASSGKTKIIQSAG